jgi:hypothetical protein
MNFSRIGFSLSPFVPSEAKSHASPAKMPKNADPELLCSARPACGTGNVGAIKCSPEGEPYNGQPNAALIGGTR